MNYLLLHIDPIIMSLTIEPGRYVSLHASGGRKTIGKMIIQADTISLFHGQQALPLARHLLKIPTDNMPDSRFFSTFGFLYRNDDEGFGVKTCMNCRTNKSVLYRFPLIVFDFSPEGLTGSGIDLRGLRGLTIANSGLFPKVTNSPRMSDLDQTKPLPFKQDLVDFFGYGTLERIVFNRFSLYHSRGQYDSLLALPLRNLTALNMSPAAEGSNLLALEGEASNKLLNILGKQMEQSKKFEAWRILLTRAVRALKTLREANRGIEAINGLPDELLDAIKRVQEVNDLQRMQQIRKTL